MKTLTILLNRGPYLSEYADLAINTALAAKNKGYNVNMYLYIDGVWAPHTKQEPVVFPNVGKHFKEALSKGVNIKICARCADARGLKGEEVLAGIPMVGLYEFINWLKESDKVITFTG